MKYLSVISAMLSFIFLFTFCTEGNGPTDEIDQKKDIFNKDSIPDNPVPDDPTPDDPIPDNPDLSNDAIKSQISKIYSNTVVINYTYNKSEVKKASQIGYCWGTLPNPTVDGQGSKPLNFDLDGEGDQGEGSIECKLTDKPGTDYYFRLYALIDKNYIFR